MSDTIVLVDADTISLVDVDTIELTADVPRIQVFDLDFCPSDFRAAVVRMEIARGNYSPEDC